LSTSNSIRPTLKFGTLRYTSGRVEEEEPLLDVAVDVPFVRRVEELPVTVPVEVGAGVVAALVGAGVETCANAPVSKMLRKRTKRERRVNILRNNE
jgi:hypothetical protein